MKRVLLLVSIILFFYINVFGQMEKPVQNFSEIPKCILEHLDKMGIDTFQVLNNYEGKYLNFVYKISVKDFDLAGKKVGFLHAGKKSKNDYFDEEKKRFYNNSTLIGGNIIYIFDAIQKEESGGYDAAIVYWSKFVIPIETVVKRLKGKSYGLGARLCFCEPKTFQQQ